MKSCGVAVECSFGSTLRYIGFAREVQWPDRPDGFISFTFCSVQLILSLFLAYQV